MTAKPKFKNGAFEAIHSSAQALSKVGGIDEAALRNFDVSRLAVPGVIEPEQIKRIREHNHMSQPVFARFLNTTESTVQKWESGAKHPSGMALKLLAVLQKHGVKVLA